MNYNFLPRTCVCVCTQESYKNGVTSVICVMMSTCDKHAAHPLIAYTSLAYRLKATSDKQKTHEEFTRGSRAISKQPANLFLV